MALLKYAFKGELQRIPLTKQYTLKRLNSKPNQIIVIRKQTSDDGQRDFYKLEFHDSPVI